MYGMYWFKLIRVNNTSEAESIHLSYCYFKRNFIEVQIAIKILKGYVSSDTGRVFKHSSSLSKQEVSREVPCLCCL
jgi:hypothetical protein